MSSDYFDSSTYTVTAGTRARASHLNNALEALDTGLALLPSETNIKRGLINYASDSGAADAYVVDLTYTPSSYTDGMEVIFKASAANTGAATINVNSLGVKTITRQDGSTLVAGDIPANKIVELRYNSTSSKFEVMGGVSATGSGTMAAQNASAVAISGGTIAGVTISSCTINNNVTGNLTGNVTGNVTGSVTGNVTGNLTGNITGACSIGGNVDVTGEIKGTSLDINGNGDVSGTVNIHDTLTLSKASGNGLVVTADIDANGAIDIASTANIHDTLTLSKAADTGLAVTANATVGGTIAVTGNASVGSLTINSVALGATPSEIDSICDGMPVQSHEDATGLTVATDTSLATLDLGTLTDGDVVLVEAYLTGTKGGTEGNLSFGIEIGGGTGAIAFNDGTDTTLYKVQHVPASAVASMHIMAVATVIITGTASVNIRGTSAGSNLGTASAWIAVTFIKKQ